MYEIYGFPSGEIVDGEAGTRGELAPGEAPDIVLLSGGPALDYRNPGAVARVLKQGRPVFGAE